jgi:restriction system protein
MERQKEHVVRTPLFQNYSDVRMLVSALAGSTTKAELLEYLNAIWDQTGTPKDPVDWSNPDEWIPVRLQGKQRAVAERIWQGSGKKLNPRHIYGAYLFLNSYELLKPDASDVYQFTERGKNFVAQDSETLKVLDEAEGLRKLLSIVAAHSPARRGDLLEEWGEFLLAHSRFKTASTFKDTLRRRMLNLVERGYIDREGNTYTITDKGVAYAAAGPAAAAQRPNQNVLSAIKEYNDARTSELRERLGKMDPYKFESLIKDLLEAMDYEDVVVTKQSGDKGVDVVGQYQFGITQIKEVVQVKRHQGSITRPVLDQLRGALPYHQAIRGTIITLGRFAQGCKDAAIFPGAAPITLIDGDKLMELLLKHGVGVKKRQATLIEIDESTFEESAGLGDSAAPDPALHNDT